jgi:hypothetical protein
LRVADPVKLIEVGLGDISPGLCFKASIAQENQTAQGTQEELHSAHGIHP